MREWRRLVDDELVVLLLDWDNCADVLSDYEPPASLVHDPSSGWARVTPETQLKRLAVDDELIRRRDAFWKLVVRACGYRPPHVVTSASARLLYQQPGKFEQDGIAHARVLEKAVALHPLTKRAHFDRTTRLPGYNAHRIPELGKVSIVRAQLARAKEAAGATRRVRVVFVDDIYATKLYRNHSKALASLLREGDSLHLVHFEHVPSPPSSLLLPRNSSRPSPVMYHRETRASTRSAR